MAAPTKPISPMTEAPAEPPRERALELGITPFGLFNTGVPSIYPVSMTPKL